MSRAFFAALAFAGCAMLQACASDQSSGAPIVISREANDHLQEYLRETDAGRMGAFAVAEDGSAAFYSICESGSCNGQYNFSADAIKGCEKFGHGRCVVLASNGVIKRAYKVAGSSNQTSSELQQLLDAALEAAFVPGERIRKELIGNSIVETSGSGKVWAEYYDPNGTVRGRSWEGVRFAGTWRIDGKTVCVDYRSIGNDWCGQFTEGDDGSIDVYQDGKFRKTYPRTVLQAGNPENL